jgi:CubicO group peptidase (beta-lactamase class C family)
MPTLRSVIQDCVGGYRAPGAVVAVQLGTSGIDIDAVDADADQLFEIGSITKTMTTLLVLQHVERGQLNLDDPIARYLPEFRPHIGGTALNVSIDQLLTHTSGLDCGDDFTDTGDGDDCLQRYVAEVINGAGLLHEPGERWSYSNAGFTLLGRLVEVLDGRSWDDAMIERIFKPLGLSATTTARLSSLQSVALGHRYDHTVGAMVEEPGRMPRSSGPAGNVVATAADLVTFAQVLFGGRGQLLHQDLLTQMITPRLNIREGGQGYAWMMPVENVAVHGGSTRGSTAFLGVIPGYGALSVVANGPGAGTMAGLALNHLLGRTPDNEPKPGNLAHVDPEACVGSFARRHATIRLTYSDSVLTAESSFWGPAAELFPQPEPVPLEPLGGGRFRSSRPYEDGFTIWDFDDLSADGVPKRLLTRRLLNRIS